MFGENTPWSHEEDAMLRDCIANRITSRVAAARISTSFGNDRTHRAARSRATHLGLSFRTSEYLATASSWPAADDATLRRMAADHATAREVGIALGKTRNAVIGRARRLGIQFKNGKAANRSPSERSERQKRAARDWGARQRFADRAERQAKPPRPPRAAPLNFDDAPVPLNLTILELTSTTCKWATTDDPPHSFCGCETFGLSYCPYHLRRSAAPRGWTPTEEQRETKRRHAQRDRRANFGFVPMAGRAG